MDELASEGRADHLRLRSRLGDFSDAAVVTVGSWGEACGQATDTGACRAAIDMLEMDPLLRSDVVISNGDDVIRLDSSVDLLDLFESIDIPTQAALYAGLTGSRSISCGEKNWRRERDGFVLKMRSHELCSDLASQRLVDEEVTVRPGGTIDVGASAPVPGDECSLARR